MAEESQNLSLLAALMERSRLPWRWTTAIVAAVLLLSLVLATLLDGTFSSLSKWEFWRNFLDAPVLIVYMLVAYPLVWRLWWRAVQALQSLLPIDDGDYSLFYLLQFLLVHA